jgi:hypothetical protein
MGSLAHRQVVFDQRPGGRGEQVMWVPRRRAVQAGGTAKTLRWEQAWCSISHKAGSKREYSKT